MGKRTTTTKAGCSTCKLRKIKCDEAKPECHRCTLKGRKCGGYGIWTTQAPTERIACRAIALSTTTATTILSQCNASETLAFEWFTTRALSKLPGPFALRYWSNLVVQVSLQEPAVLYAILALSTTHRLGSEDNLTEDDFALRAYTIAVGYLRGHAPSSKRSRLIALTACIVFVSLEYLRGQFSSACAHLQSGVRILQESTFVHVEDSRLILLHEAVAEEEVIFRAIARASLLVELFDINHRHTCTTFHYYDAISEPNILSGLESAWPALEAVFNDILYTRCVVFRYMQNYAGVLLSDLDQNRRATGTTLARWFSEFQILEPNTTTDLKHKVLFHLLHTWYTMATIMFATVLVDDALPYDEHIPAFQSIVKHATISRTLRLPATPLLTRTTTSRTFDMSHSLVDVGWIPPLYFTAVKCRVQEVRIQAIELIESAAHREGIWDSKLAAQIARQVVTVEH